MGENDLQHKINHKCDETNNQVTWKIKLYRMKLTNKQMQHINEIPFMDGNPT